MKALKSIGLAAISLVGLVVIIVFEIKEWPVGNSIAGIVLGFSLPGLYHSVQDLFDNTSWKSMQRKYERAGVIKKDTVLRISFAYLYRIKIADKYLLVKNARGTGKYQPVGGVYKLSEQEKLKIKNRYQVKDDNKVLIDESSRDDYRLRIENKYLRGFVRRFNKKADREKIDNLSREFVEELVNTGIVDWNSISYRYCGRHTTSLDYSEHFQCYELLLADVVELLPTPEQEKDLISLMSNPSDLYRFATAEEITCLGINTQNGNLFESIGDHTKKVLQETEGQLSTLSKVGQIFTVRF